MRGLIVAAALATVTPAAAAEIDFPVDVPEGAVWTVETHRLRTSQRDGKPEETETRSRYRATYRSLKGGGGLLSLRLVDGRLTDAVPGVSLEAFERPLDLEVDETLAPVRVRNWPEYREALFRLIEALAKDDPKSDPKAVEAMKDMFRGIPDEQAHQLMAPAFNYVGLGQGLALELRKPRTYEAEQPSPLSGGPIKTRASYVLESIDRKNGRAVIVWEQALDPESMRAAVMAFLRPLLEKSAKPGDTAELESVLEKASLTRDDRCRFEVHVPTGLATRVECAAVTALSAPGTPPVRRTDTWTITQSVPEVP